MLRLLCLLFVCGVLSANADVTISSVDRTLDLSTQIVKAKLVFNLEGTGSSFVFALPQTDTNHLSYVTAYGEKASDKFKVSKTKNGAVPSDYVPYEVTLTRALAAGTKTKVTVEYALTQFLRPHPAEISQADNQFVVFNGDAYVASPLTIAKQRTILKLAGGKLESHTTLEPTKNTAGQITYGPYENVKPFTKAPIAVHFENNAPFVIAANIERHIEVSHWASRVSVEEHIELQHRGARLSGAFSRLDYQMDRRGQQQPALSHFTTRLPASAQHVYYRDVIGNISTSALRYKADAVEAEIRPRFPLFGGWKTNYVIGYTLPSNEYMLHNGADKYELKLRVLDHVLDNVVVEKLTVRVVLPEKSEDIKLVTPFTVQRRPDERLATYLDTTARPVVVFEKSNVVTYHMQPFTVTYTYGSSLMWREPAMLIAAFFALFAAVIVVVRFDFSLIKVDEKLKTN